MIIITSTNKVGIIFNLMGNILSRIEQIACNEGITIGALEKKIGASKGVLSRAIANGTDIQSKWIQIIVENYPHYSAEWLLAGRGEMLKGEKLTSFSTKLTHSNPTKGINYTPSTVPTGTKDKSEAIPFAEATQTGLKQIPLVSPMAAAGFGSADFSILKEDVKEYYVIPKFKYCNVDFMIEVTGLSMHPHFNPGDVIACSILHNSQFIQWNKCHVIATREQGILVKRLMPGDNEGCLKAVSDNKEYPPFNIPLEEITGIAFVVGSVGLE